ncbi:MAG: phosphatase PAP2 family protein [Bacteroidales bacterium]|nr:phosphatase PAP2 family protein [Bacteroidales bacterium]
MDIIRLDQDITLAINGLHTNFSDLVWQTFSDRHVWFVLYLIVAAFLVWKAGWKKGLIYIAAMALCLAACDQFSNLIKLYVCRLRPCHDPYMLERGVRVLEDAGGLYGFFSSHAANAFGFAVCASQAADASLKGKSRWFTWFIYVWAALVSVSRIFVGKHYLGDILVGILVGLVLGYVFASLGHWVCSKLKDKPTDR